MHIARTSSPIHDASSTVILIGEFESLNCGNKMAEYPIAAPIITDSWHDSNDRNARCE